MTIVLATAQANLSAPFREASLGGSPSRRCLSMSQDDDRVIDQMPTASDSASMVMKLGLNPNSDIGMNVRSAMSGGQRDIAVARAL